MQEINIALLGLGTVGSGSLELLQTNQAFLEQKTGYKLRVVTAVVKNIKKKRNLNLSGIKITSNLKDALADKNINLIFDATGDNQVGIFAIQSAIKNQKKIITANKALLAEHWKELNQELCTSDAIAFESTVAGTIPIIDALKNGLSANKISAIYGIVNGTCNYILSQMEQLEMDFDFALKEAMEKGFAELDPTLDIGGFDSAHKLIIMMNLIYQSYFNFSLLPVEGIQKINKECFLFAQKMDYSIKLLAVTKKINENIHAYVHPTLVPKNHPLAKVSGVENAVFVKGNFCGSLMFTGSGAGSKPTASAMVSDMVQLLVSSKNTETQIFRPANFLPIAETFFEYFILFDVIDKIGVLKTITQIFYKSSISIKSMLQEDTSKKSLVKIILVTHQAKEKKMLEAIQKLKTKEFVASEIQFIRIFGDF